MQFTADFFEADNVVQHTSEYGQEVDSSEPLLTLGHIDLRIVCERNRGRSQQRSSASFGQTLAVSAVVNNIKIKQSGKRKWIFMIVGILYAIREKQGRQFVRKLKKKRLGFYLPNLKILDLLREKEKW